MPITQKIVQRMNPKARLLMTSTKTEDGLNELVDIVLHGKHEVTPLLSSTAIRSFARSVAEIGWRGEEYAIETKRILNESDVKNLKCDLLGG